MTEPTVPVLSQSILERKPRPSGICPPRSLALMFGAGLPISIVVGVIAHYIGILVGWLGGLIAALPNLLFGACGFIACGAVIFALVVIAAVVFGYPIVVGVVAGGIVGELGKLGKCRNTHAAGLAGAFNGVIIYAVHALVAFLVTASLHVLTVNTSTLEDLFDVTLDGTPWWMYVLVIIEAIIVIVASAATASGTVGGATFCEEHEVWYGPWREARLPVEHAEPIAQALETGTLQGLEDVARLTSQNFPHLLMRIRRCPTSPSCDVEITGKVVWQEKKVDKKGKESTEQHSKEWFDTMVPPGLGEALEKAMGLDPDITDAW
jgi:hypothetical protein